MRALILIPLLITTVTTLVVYADAHFSTPDNLNSNIELLLNHDINDNEPGALVLTMADNRVRSLNHRGVANIETQDSINSKTQFRLASLSKSFTAYAIFQLEQDGKLKTNDTISSYLNGIPSSWQHLTVSDLLYNQTGINDIFSLLDIKALDYTNTAISFDEVVSLILTQAHLNDLSTKKPSLYSNSNYVLLAKVIENVTNQSFPDWMHQQVFKPLGMKSTYVETNNQKSGGELAIGYYESEEGLEYATHRYEMHGAVGVVSNAQDMQRWLTHLHHDSEPVVSKLFERPENHNFGGGVFVYDYEQDKAVDIEMFAYVLGYNSFLYMDRNNDISILFLSNADKLVAGEYFNEVLASIYNGTHPIKDTFTYTVENSKLQAYEGIYLSKPNYPNELNTPYLVRYDVKDNSLFFKHELGNIPLIPTGFEQFRSKFVPKLKIEFKFGHSDYKAETLISYGLEYQRIEPTNASPVRAGIAGKYRNDALDLDIEIVVSDNRITYHHPYENTEFTLYDIGDGHLYSGMYSASMLSPHWTEDQITAFSLSGIRAANVEFVRVD